MYNSSFPFIKTNNYPLNTKQNKNMPFEIEKTRKRNF